MLRTEARLGFEVGPENLVFSAARMNSLSCLRQGLDLQVFQAFEVGEDLVKLCQLCNSCVALVFH